MSRDSKSERRTKLAAVRALPTAAIVGYLRVRHSRQLWVKLRCERGCPPFALERHVVEKRKRQPTVCPHCMLTTVVPEVK